MITVQPGYESAVLVALLTDAEPTTEQQLALVEELVGDPVGRGYAGKTHAEKLALLCEPYSVLNPDPAGTVPIDSITGATLKIWLRGVLNRAVQMNGSVGSKWASLSAAYSPTITDAEPILRSSQTLQGFSAQMAADGILLPGELDALFSEPDPAYQATLHHPARIRTIWGDGLLPTLADIKEVLG